MPPPSPSRSGARRPSSATPSRAGTKGAKGAKGAKGVDARRSILWRWRRALFMLALVFMAGLAGLGFVLSSIDLPPERFQAQTSFVCAADVQADCNQDNAMARLFAEEDRVSVTLDQVPEVMIQAVLSAEDQDFFEHQGVDPIGIARAAWNDIRGGSITQGGSTITQQYVKNVYLTNERTITRKIREAVLAIKLEQELSKEEILERYLNTIYFGRGAYGIGAAARAYFGHDVTELDLAEAAYLAGLIRAPEAADAARVPEEASRRRRTVLQAMLGEGYIDEAAFAAADAEPWIVADATNADTATVLPRRERQGLGDVRDSEYGTEYFVEYVRRQLLELGFSDNEIYGGGLRVYTTLDYATQRAAWTAVESVLDQPEDPPAALVAVDGDGFVRAMVGGRDFGASEVNLALGEYGGGTGRQAGSAMKPFVLAAAVQQGISLQSRFESPSRITIPDANAGEDWVVNNYGGTEQGVLSLIDATRVSSNTAYAQLMMEVDPAAVVPLANRMGITSELDPVPALVLGTEEVSPYDMASAYSTLANGGVHVEPTAIVRVERPDGSVVTPRQDREQALSAEQAAQVVFCLRQVVERGTATAARIGVPAAGKTGTTQDNRDAWFIGFLPNGMTASVWMGYDPNPDGSPRYMNDVHGRAVTGGSFPAEIWHDFMQEWVEISGAEVGRFPSVESFPGRMLNTDLETTTSTLAPCPADGTTTGPCVATTTSSTTSSSTSSTSSSTSSSSSSTSTSTTTSTTTTTLPPTTPTTPPDDDDD